GVSERTLRKHFRTFMAVSPLNYWRQLRLAAARSQLLEGSNTTSVTEVATRFGFTHISRFAQDYRRHFGEAPSSTLQRSRVNRHERTGRPRTSDAGAISVAPKALRDRPSIAVLPLENSGVDADCRTFGEYLCRGNGDGSVSGALPYHHGSEAISLPIGRLPAVRFRFRGTLSPDWQGRPGKQSPARQHSCC